MNIIYGILYGLWWGFLRRWFGGLFPDEKYKILGNRGLQTIFMLISLFPVIYSKTLYNYPTHSLIFNLITASFITFWIQFQFWSRGHGGTFADMGRTQNPNTSRYDRWFKKPLDKCWDILLSLKEKYTFFKILLKRWSGRRYGYTYDMVYHTIRYTLCMLLPAFLLHNIVFIVIGLLSAPCYELLIRFYEKYKLPFMKLSWLSSPNKLTEIIYGFIFGFGILLF